MTNAAGFRLELDRMAQAIQAEALTAQRRVVLDLFRTVNMANPVGNPTTWAKPRKGYVGGQSRRNWRLSFAPGGSVKPGKNPAPRGGMDIQSQAEAETFLLGMREPTSLWLTNPMPYMDRLEAGWSPQAPAGWVRNAVTVIAAKYGLRAT